MATTYQDYYKILGLSRNATTDGIKKAYRKLARKYHPDINKEKTAEENFKKITEANEVLRDPEKRKLYDQLGANWKSGQEFRPPPEWEQTHFNQGSDPHAGEFHFGSRGDYSEFFESLFGARVRDAGEALNRQHTWAIPGQDHEAKIDISLEEAFAGMTKNLSLKTFAADAQGQVRPHTNTYQVRIPAGVTDGTLIRMAGKGGKGIGGGPQGHLYLKVHLLSHPRFKVSGHDISFDLPVTPWEAALGKEVTVSLLDGDIQLKIPPQTQTGKRMRLKGKGFPRKGGQRGDLFVRIKIVIPKSISDKEKELYAQMASISTYNPREN